MPRQSKKDIVKRWTNDKVSLVEKALSATSIDNVELSSAFGIHDRNGTEFVDLRGFPFRRPYRNVQISHLDFEFCEWLPGKGGLTPVDKAVNCVFDNCKLDCPVNKYFDNCSFKNSKLIGSQSVPGTMFQDCSFESCHFKSSFFQGCEFVRCRFDSAKIRNTEFFECLFDGCVFVGAQFKHSSFGDSIFQNAKNNFRFEPDEKIIDPEYPLVDFMDSLMGGVKIS
jgi:uncharacterized protein YjbI with pentapeptide repeats